MLKSYEAEIEKIRNEMEPVVASCQLKNQLDPNFDNLTWPVSDTKTLSNYKLDNKSLEISVLPQSEIIAVAEGRIVSVADPDQDSSSIDKIVIIDHDNHLLSIYAGPSEIMVKLGQVVLEGDLIGYSSKIETGSLHFELRHCYREINPMDFFQN